MTVATSESTRSESVALIVAAEPRERRLDRGGAGIGDPPAQRPTRRREHDRERSAVATWVSLDEPGLDQTIDEAHRAGVGQSRRAGKLLGRAAAEELVERDERGRCGSGHARGTLGRVSQRIRDRQREGTEHVDQVRIA